jgi:spore germination protein YaaH
MLVVALTLIAALIFTLWRLSATATSYPPAHFNEGHNAVWLEHAWAGTPHTAAEYDQLATQLTQEQIGYVFVHVGPLASDGTIPTSLAPNARTFATQMHERLPGLRIMAWIGQLEAASGQSSDQTINLENSTVREHIAQTAAHFVGLGMNGVHYDIEPITNNNPRFLDLLDETRAVLPPGALLSVAAQKWAPNAHVADWAFHVGRADAWWTSYYYTQVASHVDQLVVMAYNTAMPTAGLYELAIKQETQHILEAAEAAPHPPRVMIGLPSYTGNSTWFHDQAENVRSGLKGVADGLNSGSNISSFDGVAIYRYGTTTDADWADYRALWLSGSST